MSEKKVNLYSDVAKSSLQNAEQWTKDARLLIENSSYGHGSALLRFAYEEIGKALICWLVYERIFPADSKPVREVFRSHSLKNELISGMCKAVFIGAIQKRVIERQPQLGPTDEEITAALTLFRGGPTGMERLRQRAMYVDIDSRRGRVISPETASEDEAKRILRAVEIFYGYARNMMGKMSEQDKKAMRGFFDFMPKEMWKTGKIRPVWPRDFKEHIQSQRQKDKRP